MKRHDLKTWPEYYEAILDGSKQFEIRKNDRGFQVGDILHLQEWNPLTLEYTGRGTTRIVTYIVQGSFGLPDDVCVMSLAG